MAEQPMGHGVKQRDVIKMSDAEVDAFLQAGRTMSFATMNHDATIHVVAMWYGFLEGAIAFETKAKSQKVRNLLRNPTITCMVEAGTTYEELRGVELVGTAVAVALSSVRFLPIVVALVPLVKRDNARPWKLVLPVHFMAVSVWVEAVRHAPGMPREHRIPFCNGLSVGYMGTATTFGFAGFYLAAGLPPLFAATLLFLTPMSFLISTARNARMMVDRLTLVLGIGLGALFTYYQVQFEPV